MKEEGCGQAIHLLTYWLNDEWIIKYVSEGLVISSSIFIKLQRGISDYYVY